MRPFPKRVAIAATLALCIVAIPTAPAQRAGKPAAGAAPAAGLQITIEIEQLSQLGIPALEQLQTLGPVRGDARLSIAGEKLRFDDLRVRVAAADAQLEIEGTVGDAERWQELDLTFRLQASSASWLTTGINTPGAGPLSFTGHVTSDGASWRFSELVLSTKATHITGSIKAVANDDARQISGRFEATTLDLDEFIAPGNGLGSDDGRLFPDVSLPLAPTPGLNADLTLTAAQMRLHGLLLENATTSLSADASQTRLNSAGQHAGGQYDAVLTRKLAGAATDTALQLKLNRIAWGQASQQFGFDDFIDGGPTDARIDIYGHGNSLREFLASMNGELGMRAGRSRILNSVLHEAGIDLLDLLVGLFTPAEDQAETTAVECAALYLQIRDGIAYAKDDFVVLTDKVAMAGTGQLDFRDESLSLKVRLNAREGLTISTLSLAGDATVDGTLMAPTVDVGSASVATTATTIAGAIATGGLSILGQNLINSAMTGAARCSAVLDIPEESPIAAGAATPPAREPEHDAGPKAEAEAEPVVGEKPGTGILEGFGHTLKELFAN